MSVLARWGYRRVSSFFGIISTLILAFVVVAYLGQTHFASKNPEEISMQSAIDFFIGFPSLALDSFESNDNIFLVLVFNIIVTALLVLSLILQGKMGAPRFLGTSGSYERVNPIPNAHPITLSRLWNGCALVDDMILATLALANTGAIQIKATKTPNAYGTLRDDLQITVIPNWQSSLPNTIDIALYDFFLVESDNGQTVLSFLAVFSKENVRVQDSPLREFIVKFFQITRNEAIDSGLFPGNVKGKAMSLLESAARGLFAVCISMPIVVNLSGIVMIGYLKALDFSTVDIIVFLVMNCIPWLVYALLFLFFDLKRNANGQRMLSRCRYLKRWLEDFTGIRDKPVTPGILFWGEYAVYAYALDAAEASISNLSFCSNSVHLCVAEIIYSREERFPGEEEKLLSNILDGRAYYQLIQGQFDE